VPGGNSASDPCDVSAIVDRLEQVIEPEYISVWLNTSVPALGNEKPIDLLVRGEWQPVLRVISGLESPGFS